MGKSSQSGVGGGAAQPFSQLRVRFQHCSYSGLNKEDFQPWRHCAVHSHSRYRGQVQVPAAAAVAPYKVRVANRLLGRLPRLAEKTPL